jgi:Tfp pilus assembly protein PilO
MPKTIYIVAFLLIILILGAVLIWPKYQELNAIKIEIGAKETELQNIGEYYSDLEQTNLGLEEYADNLAKIETSLPSGPSLPSFLNFLQEKSSENGVVLKTINFISSPSPISGKSKIKETSLNISFSAPYSAFKNFLSTLENSARLIEVESISFSSPEEKEKPFEFNLGLKIHSY